MCTLSWKPTEDGYVLRFNRDEQRSRKPALAPTLRQRNHVTFLAPTDAERGGSWMLVNAHGLSICLLNHYPESPPPNADKTESRGNLVLALADCATVIAAMKRCESMQLTSYPPFQLVMIDVAGGAQLTWDGHSYSKYTLNIKGAMLSSSSFRSKAIAHTRHETLNRIVGDISKASNEQLETFHYQRDADSAASVRMSRPDACTHNIARVEISGVNIKNNPGHKYGKDSVAKFFYEPQPEISPTEDSIDIELKLHSSNPVCVPSL